MTRRIPTHPSRRSNHSGRPTGSERSDRPDRRRRLRGLDRVRWTLQYAYRRATGRQRPQVQPLPHDRALFANPLGTAHGSQPPRRRYGSDHEIATSAPGYTSVWPNTAAPLAEILKLNGYSTAQLGKCHEVPVWETSPMGPYRQWPTGKGFEYFYGFIGEAHQYYPAIYEGDPRRAGEDARRGLPLHDRHDGSRDRMGPSAEGADARQAVLHVLRSRRDTRAPPRPEGVGGQVRGEVRRWLGRRAGRIFARRRGSG